VPVHQGVLGKGGPVLGGGTVRLVARDHVITCTQNNKQGYGSTAMYSADQRYNLARTNINWHPLPNPKRLASPFHDHHSMTQ
jgi:hypothetical protein